MRHRLPADLARRIERLRLLVAGARVLRGAATLVAVGCAVYLTLALVDLGVSLGGGAIRAAATLLVGGLGLAAACGIGWLAWRHPTFAGTAARVDAAFPALDERLSSLAGADDRPLWDEVAREAETMAAGLDFRQAVDFRPMKTSLRAAALGVTLVGATWFVPAMAGFAERFFQAWTPAVHGFAIVTSPTEGPVALGRPVAIEATLERRASGVRMPSDCVLSVCGVERAMTPSGDGRFVAVLPEMPERLEYRVRAGALTTAPVELVAVAPVTVLASQVSLTAPAYATAKAEVREVDAPFSVVQHSFATFRFQLDRAPVSATFRWRDASGERDVPLVPTTGQAWEAVVSLRTIGPVSGQATFTAAPGIDTSAALAGGRVWADEPPYFTGPARVGGADASQPWAVTPDAVLRVDAPVADAVGLDRFDVEYRVNEGPVETATLARFAGATTGLRAGPLALKGRAKVGDRVDVRLRVWDNRRVGDAGPQSAVEPREGWRTFRVEAKADPVETQAILAERDQFADRLRQIRKELADEKSDLDKAIRAGHGMTWTAEQGRLMSEARKKNAGNEAKLRTLAAEASERRGLAPLARGAKDVADRELRSADRALTQAEARDLFAAKRETHLRDGENQLASALRRVDELLKLNEMLAQDRLRQQSLDGLASREEDLAQRAAAGEVDPMAAQKEQQAIAAALEAWAKQQPELAQAMKAAEAKMLAMKATELAKNTRAGAKTDVGALREKLKKALAGLAVRQAELAGSLDRDNRDRFAGLEKRELLVDSAPGHRAAKALVEGDAVSAIGDEEKSLASIAGVDDRLRRTWFTVGDARAIVAKAAETQARTAEDLEQLGKDFARIGPEETRKRLAELRARQADLTQALGTLPDTPDRRDALASVAEATQAFGAKDLVAALEALERSRDRLRRWLPTIPEATPAASAALAEGAETLRQAQFPRLAAQKTEQQAILDETRKILYDALQHGGGAGEGKDDPSKALDDFKNEAMKFAQKMDGPEAKAMAGESAQAADDAKKEMDAAQEARKAGMFDEAEKRDEEAALKLEFAAQKLADAADAMQPKGGGKDGPLAQAIDEAQKLMRPMAAQPPTPQQMQAAAKTLRKASLAAGNQMQARSLAPPGPPSAGVASDPPGPAELGIAWGDLPGEVRARVTQDLRARYGDEYEAIIDRYFRNLAERKR